jgi:hypothetical protein
MWIIVTAILFIIGWLWIAYEMFTAPKWDGDKFDITDEEVMDDLNSGTEVTNTDDQL